jgi:hypothetical protein
MIAVRESAGWGFPPTRRWLLWGFRALVVAVLFLLLLLGVRDVIRSSLRSAGQNGSDSSVGGPAGFPREAAEAYATRFALAYATFDSADTQARQQTLQQYVPDGVDTMLGWDGQGKQTATAAFPSGIDIRDQSNATISVAVQVDRGRWLYLAVPVVVHQDRLVVPAAPSMLPAPAKATVSASPAVPEDTQTESQLTPLVTSFFKNYASSSMTDLGLIAAPGTTFEGLNGTVQFGSLVDLRVNQGSGSTRQAIAHVRWSDPASNASLVQGYRLTLVLVNGQWHVSSLTPAAS